MNDKAPKFLKVRTASGEVRDLGYPGRGLPKQVRPLSETFSAHELLKTTFFDGKK